MRGVDLYRRSPLRSGREAAAAAALFAVSPTAQSAGGKGPLLLQRPRKGGSSATASTGRRRARLRLERAPSAGLALRPRTRPASARLDNPRLSPFGLLV